MVVVVGWVFGTVTPGEWNVRVSFDLSTATGRLFPLARQSHEINEVEPFRFTDTSPLDLPRTAQEKADNPKQVQAPLHRKKGYSSEESVLFLGLCWRVYCELDLSTLSTKIIYLQVTSVTFDQIEIARISPSPHVRASQPIIAGVRFVLRS